VEWRVDAALEEHRKNHCLDHYLMVRERLGSRSPSFAADFIYLNKACFNGLWRVNKSGKFNVPYGKLKNVCLPDPEELISYRDAMNGARFYADHFSISMNRPIKGDFVYCDPPYIPRNATSNFTAYTNAGFDADEHARLRDKALELKNRGVRVLLSNSDTPLAWELYSKDFKIEVVQARRAINAKGDGRGKVTELLIS
jgi:DNA adenine methylase